MDDILEQPTSSVPRTADNPDDAAQSSDEDDGGPDWTKLSAMASADVNKPFIPKRGEKEFEPAGEAGTNLQQHKLEQVRAAMFSALDVERTVSNKVASYAVWYPNISRARMITARGNHLVSMGHNVPRILHMDGLAETQGNAQKNKKAEKVTELLPEEALYLIERGSMFCWSQIDDMRHFRGEEDVDGTPMTLQHAYAQMIGREDLTLERYQVFTYLKRLGYTVTRARAPDAFYHTPPPYPGDSASKLKPSLFSRVTELLLTPFRRLLKLRPLNGIDWWRPLRTDGPVHRFFSYSSIFSALRFITCGYGQPLQRCSPSGRTQDAPSPYEVFFNLYKPATSFRKTAPPPPDYSVIVVNARTTPMPTIQELSQLFEDLPELPPPVPRKRFIQNKPAPITEQKNFKTESAASSPLPSNTLLSWLRRMFRSLFRIGETKSAPPPRRPNPFQMLKMGKKMIVVAAVDAGSISFFRFCQGAFDEWPMA